MNSKSKVEQLFEIKSQPFSQESSPKKLIISSRKMNKKMITTMSQPNLKIDWSSPMKEKNEEEVKKLDSKRASEKSNHLLKPSFSMQSKRIKLTKRNQSAKNIGEGGNMDFNTREKNAFGQFIRSKIQLVKSERFDHTSRNSYTRQDSFYFGVDPKLECDRPFFQDKIIQSSRIGSRDKLGSKNNNGISYQLENNYLDNTSKEISDKELTDYQKFFVNFLFLISKIINN